LFPPIRKKSRTGMKRNFGSLPGRPRRVKAVLAGLVLMLALPSTPARAAGAYTSVLLERLRKATLGRPLSSISSIHLSGRIEVVGLKGSFQEWDDLRGRRFATAQDAGALSGGSGWDGKTAWTQDYAGLVTIDAGTAGRLQSIDQAYLDNLAYLRPDGGGATIVYAGRRTDGGATYDLLAVTPPQGTEIDLWIDPATHLIVRETGTIGAISQTTTLSNYRRADGITLPFYTSSQTSTGNSVTEHVSSVTINGETGERMRVPQSNVRDFSIRGGTQTIVPIQVINNHIYLSAMVNDRGPYTFIVDTGGDYIITPQLASALAAKTSGGMQLSGAGSATEGASFTRIDSVAVGGAIVRNQYALVLPIDTGFGMAEGMHIDGMIGYQFLARFLTTVDYAGSKVTLALPPSPAPAGAAAIAFYIDGSIPRIPITIDGVSTTAEVDTGSRGGLILSAPFVAEHPALAALAKTQPTVEGFGVGGASYARLGRVPSIGIGPYSIGNTIAAFGVQTKGAMADPFNPANIGGAILRRFTVTFDYRGSRMLLLKSPAFDAPPTYDRSGLFVIDQNGAYTILSSVPGSTAGIAGLTKNDVILSVNGTPTAKWSLSALRALLSGPTGTVVHLHIRGPRGNERDVTLTLSDYV
jgi:predicted aspartyl protease